MISKLLIPTNFICLFSLLALTGCAGMFQRNSGEDWDSTQMSQSAPDTSNNDVLDINSEEYHRTHVARAIQSQDIVPGMSQQEVVSAWGRPRDVEVAGDGTHGNERWIYYTGNSLRYGISKPRVIYFENGRVAGWESGR